MAVIQIRLPNDGNRSVSLVTDLSNWANGYKKLSRIPNKGSEMVLRIIFYSLVTFYNTCNMDYYEKVYLPCMQAARDMNEIVSSYICHVQSPNSRWRIWDFEKLGNDVYKCVMNNIEKNYTMNKNSNKYITAIKNLDKLKIIKFKNPVRLWNDRSDSKDVRQLFFDVLDGKLSSISEASCSINADMTNDIFMIAAYKSNVLINNFIHGLEIITTKNGKKKKLDYEYFTTQWYYSIEPSKNGENYLRVKSSFRINSLDQDTSKLETADCDIIFVVKEDPRAKNVYNNIDANNNLSRISISHYMLKRAIDYPIRYLGNSSIEKIINPLFEIKII